MIEATATTTTTTTNTSTTTYDHSIHTYMPSLSVVNLSAWRWKTATVWAYNEMRGGLWLAGWCWVPTAAVSVCESERDRKRPGIRSWTCLTLPPLENGQIAITFDIDVAQESASYQSCVVFYELFSGTGRVAVASILFLFSHVEVSVMHSANPSTRVHLFTR